MTATKKIALVDDDKNILTSLSIAFENENFEVSQYNDGVSALEGLANNPPDIAIFDIKMPRMDGMELMRRYREKSSIPVIFLTSKDDEIDELMGLKIGADDYIKKPFSQKLVIERVKTILKRSKANANIKAQNNNNNPSSEDHTNTAEANGYIVRGDLEIDEECHLVKWQGQTLTLTVTEFLILKSLAHRPNVVRSRNDLMDAAYSDDVFVDDRTIDSHIKRLRKKFKNIDPNFDRIEALYGLGYKFKI